jgi:hypothetical protein
MYIFGDCSPTTNIHDRSRSSAGTCIHFNTPIPLPQIYMTAHVLGLVYVYTSIHRYPYHKYIWVMYICGRGIGVLNCIHVPALERERSCDTPTTNIHDLSRSRAGTCIHFNTPIPLRHIYMTAHVLGLVHVYISIHRYPYHKYT